MAKTPACRAGDPGSIPGVGVNFLECALNRPLNIWTIIPKYG